MGIDLDEALAVCRFEQRDCDRLARTRPDVIVGVALMDRVRARSWRHQQVLMDVQPGRACGWAAMRVMAEGDRDDAAAEMHPAQGDSHLIGTSWRA